MSLLQRVERAQRAAESARAQIAEADAAKIAEADAATPARGGKPTGASTALVPRGSAKSPTAAPPPDAPAAAAVSPDAATQAAVPAREELLRGLALRLQQEFSTAYGSRLDTAATDLPAKIGGIVDGVVREAGFAVTRDERKRLIDGMLQEITGLGPLEPLLLDDSITEIMVNGPHHIYIERAGKIKRVDVHFLNNEHVRRIIDRIIAPLGRRIDESSPRVDARLPDGSRVNAVIAPLSLVGPVITIRKFSARPYTVDDLIGFGTASSEMFAFLQACIEARLNIFVSGGTGSGKTTTLNVLSSFIPETERIVTIEDAAELQLRQMHVVTLEARPPNIEGLGEVTIRDLLRNALHMRPDRIIVGECRSGEALDMLQAMTTGQDGSLSTGHANSPRDMLRRIETMVLMAGYELPLRAIREQIASAVDLIVHTARLKDGSRRIVNITEVYGVEDDEILTQDIFVFEQTGVKDKKIQGVLKPTGIRPTFMPKFKANGIALPPGDFGIPAEETVQAVPARSGGDGSGSGDERHSPIAELRSAGIGRAVTAGGMVYVSSIGPIDPETGRVVSAGIKEQTRQCMRNLQEKLEATGSSLEKVVWANWSLRDPAEFDIFSEEWVRWFPNEAPVGQGTLMPSLQRRAGFRISIGVIAEA